MFGLSFVQFFSLYNDFRQDWCNDISRSCQNRLSYIVSFDKNLLKWYILHTRTHTRTHTYTRTHIHTHTLLSGYVKWNIIKWLSSFLYITSMSEIYTLFCYASTGFRYHCLTYFWCNTPATGTGAGVLHQKCYTSVPAWGVR